MSGEENIFQRITQSKSEETDAILIFDIFWCSWHLFSFLIFSLSLMIYLWFPTASKAHLFQYQSSLILYFSKIDFAETLQRGSFDQKNHLYANSKILHTSNFMGHFQFRKSINLENFFAEIGVLRVPDLKETSKNTRNLEIKGCDYFRWMGISTKVWQISNKKFPNFRNWNISLAVGRGNIDQKWYFSFRRTVQF